MPTALPPALRAVVFDLDGTLIDSAPDIGAALNVALVEAGRRAVTPAEVIKMIGNGVQKLVERGFAATGEPLEDVSGPLATFRANYAANTMVHTKPYPGAFEAVRALQARGISLGLCTNKPEAPARDLLEGFGIADAFDAVFGGDSLGETKKPDPAHVHAVLETLCVTPEGAVMIGDSAADIDAAKAVPMHSVAVSWGYAKVPVTELGAHVIIDDYAALMPHLAEHFAL